MKNIFKYFIPAMALVFSMTSCYDTMDDKADIDAKYESKFEAPTISIADAASPFYSTIDVTLAIADTSTALEIGVQVADEDGSFEEAEFIAADSVSNNYVLSVEGFEELTTYTIRAYAVPTNGGAIVYSEAMDVTTISAPLVDLAGTYTVVDYKYASGAWEQFCNPYQVTIAFDEGSDDIVNVTGLAFGSIQRYSAGEPLTVQGMYDADAQTVTIPNNAVVANTTSYGNIWIVADEAPALVLKFNPKGGAIESEISAYKCGAGNLGYFYHVMQHD